MSARFSLSGLNTFLKLRNIPSQTMRKKTPNSANSLQSKAYNLSETHSIYSYLNPCFFNSFLAAHNFSTTAQPTVFWKEPAITTALIL